jgi:hypothetical protein
MADTTVIREMPTKTSILRMKGKHCDWEVMRGDLPNGRETLDMANSQWVIANAPKDHLVEYGEYHKFSARWHVEDRILLPVDATDEVVLENLDKLFRRCEFVFEARI